MSSSLNSGCTHERMKNGATGQRVHLLDPILINWQEQAHVTRLYGNVQPSKYGSIYFQAVIEYQLKAWPVDGKPHFQAKQAKSSKPSREPFRP
ncbi:hypothetical protein VNO77_23285 [Canavalia gladiata]|uniref:Uncharacterized protein n=1 Tax=Canavalia gladiata TaxID=3824 RepID=A0AAN9L7K1_CANGL